MAYNGRQTNTESNVSQTPLRAHNGFHSGIASEFVPNALHKTRPLIK